MVAKGLFFVIDYNIQITAVFIYCITVYKTIKIMLLGVIIFPQPAI